jgi:hypothetical protein
MAVMGSGGRWVENNRTSVAFSPVVTLIAMRSVGRLLNSSALTRPVLAPIACHWLSFTPEQELLGLQTWPDAAP